MLTDEGVFTLGDEIKKNRDNNYIKLKLNLSHIYFVYSFSKRYNIYATSDGYYIIEGNKASKIDIDGINDILFIYKNYVLTTTGLYSVTDYEELFIKKIINNSANVKKMIMQRNGLYVLTHDNKLLYLKHDTADLKEIFFPDDIVNDINELYIILSSTLLNINNIKIYNQL